MPQQHPSGIAALPASSHDGQRWEPAIEKIIRHDHPVTKWQPKKDLEATSCKLVIKYAAKGNSKILYVGITARCVYWWGIISYKYFSWFWRQGHNLLTICMNT